MSGQMNSANVGRLAAVLLAALTIASCVAVAPPAQPPSADYYNSEEKLIRQSLATYAAARQRGDGIAQAARYAEDAELWHTLSKRGLVRSRSAIQNLFLAHKAAPFRLEPVNISFATADVALVDAHFFGPALDPNGVAYYVMVKRGGEWLIRAVRFMPLPERKSP